MAAISETFRVPVAFLLVLGLLAFVLPIGSQDAQADTMDISWTSEPPLTGQVGVEYTYIPATAPTASFLVKEKTAWLGWNGAILSGTPTEAGNHFVSIGAYNDMGGALQEWTINVAGAAEISWTSTPPTSGMALKPYSYAPMTNQTVNFMVQDRPAWLEWDGATLSGIPPEVGNYSVSVLAFKGTWYSWQNWTIDVSPYSGPFYRWAPTFISSPPTACNVSERYTYTPGVNETATISVLQRPSWLIWDNADGTLSGRPNEAGTYAVSIAAVNLEGRTTYQNWVVIVADKENGTAPEGQDEKGSKVPPWLIPTIGILGVGFTLVYVTNKRGRGRS